MHKPTVVGPPWAERPRSPRLQKLIDLITSPAAIAVAITLLELLLTELKRRYRSHRFPTDDHESPYFRDEY